MNRRIIAAALAGLLLTSGGFRLPLCAAMADTEEVDVVVNKLNSVNTLSLDEARAIFKCEKTFWPGGKYIKVLMLAPGEPEREVALRELYKMKEADYIKYFLQAVFSGKVQAPPRVLESAAQMKQLLAASPVAIGYLKKSDVDDSVKVVLRLQ